MSGKRSLPRWLSLTVLLAVTALLLPSLQAGSFPELGSQVSTAQLRERALQYQADGLWSKASVAWEQYLARERNSDKERQNYQHCLRRAQQVRRHADNSYRRQAQSLTLTAALQIYQEILGQLKNGYVDHEKVDPLSLYMQGVDELTFALSNEAFCQAFLKNASLTEIRIFQEQVLPLWLDKPIRKLEDAVAAARDLAFAAQKALGLSPTLAVLEMGCGACSGLDEHTFYLPPAQYNEMTAAWKGELIGIGIEVGVEVGMDNTKQLVIAQVIPGSPAHLQGLRVRDRIGRIGTKSTLGMSAETAIEMLKGDVDTTVEIEIFSLTEMRTRLLTLKRQLLHVASVSEPRFLDMAMGVAYLQVLAFQETTLHELDEAIGRLQSAGMRALVLDLRGNPGGLFDVARQVAERFLSAGVIVTTRGQGEYNSTYFAHGMNILAVPLVVLVDGETASSAEMVAGALKDNQRGRLVGRTTFGKGSIQKVRKLSGHQAGIRMTVAKFYSPRNQAYNITGVVPHHDVAGSDFVPDLEQDPQVEAGVRVARELAMGR